MIRWLWSRFWDYCTPCEILRRMLGNPRFNESRILSKIECIEIAICELFPDSWFDQND